MSKSIIEILTERFPKHKFHLEESSYGGVLYTFYITPLTETDLEHDWENIRNSIAVYFQTNLEIEFTIWNIYLFFISPFELTKGLKHRIEHDTISSRKIIIENHPKQNDDDFFKVLFSEHISNDNLKINAPILSEKKFSKNRVLSSIIDKIDLSVAKSKKDAEFGKAFKELEKKLFK